MGNKLTNKQLRFIEAYDGNGTAAARAAGYKGSDAVLNAVAYENLRKPMIAEEIRKREERRNAKGIATREERQLFWTEVMKDYSQCMRDRLKGAELLGRSEADFTDKIQLDVSDSLAELMRLGEERLNAIKK